MTNIGLDHFYCNKAFQFLELQPDEKWVNQAKGLLIEYAMWLAYQRDPLESKIKAIEASYSDEIEKAIHEAGSEESWLINSYLRYKINE